jgi:CBS domain containing-hemolysin-like protein
MNTWVALTIAAVLVLANAFFVAVEFSLVAVDRTEIELAAASGDRRAGLVSRALSRLSFHLSGVQLGITVTSVVLGFLAEPAVAALLRPLLADVLSEQVANSLSLVLALVIATVVQMVVAELVPKAIAVARPRETATRLARANQIFSTVCSPIIRAFSGTADAVVRALGMEPKEELEQVRSRSELVRLVESSSAEGTLQSGEASLLRNVFRFGEKQAADALTPRTRLITLSSGSTGADLMALSAETGHSRFPVLGRDADDVIGVVHLKRLLDLLPKDRRSVLVDRIMDEPFVVPESRDLDTLLAELRQRAVTMAVVLDEYGGTAGIVTTEDLIEEIVGEIEDEHDVSEPSSPPVPGERRVISGDLRADELRDAIAFVLPDGEYETIAGFLMDRLGRVLVEGDVWVEDPFRFEVLAMDRHRLTELGVDTL